MISRPFLEKNFLSEALISSKSLLEFKFPTNRENAGKQGKHFNYFWCKNALLIIYVDILGLALSLLLINVKKAY